ncbi:hypothetical protein RHSIM_Rhsim10G0199200 [Rhododendron simsii]|uniref:Uncharacterized protein n=1 Tax=Rhododendron simsii TaxID=118357 RepID=A0A834GD16_RHOSS|nr:hypothetical protein RHSIM_Rhsim10G0199200 [Rhododendron simsii]
MYRFNEVKKPLYSAMGRSYELMEVRTEIERAHLNCFPKVGEIRADGLMVKEKSFFYHLPDSLPIKHVFQGAKGTWFIHIEVCSRRVSDKSGLSESPSAEIKDQTSNSCNITDSLEHENILSRSIFQRNRRGYRKITFYILQWKGLSKASVLEMKEILIQRKLFASITKELTKVDREQMKAATDDNCLEARASAMPQFKPKTPPRSFPSMLPTDLSCKTSRNNIKRPDVGKHLVVAASVQKSATGLCGRRDRKLLVPKSSSLVRSILFEVGKRFSCWVGAEKIETLSLEDFWTKSSINISFSWRLETLLRLGFWSGYQSYAVHYASTEVYRKSHLCVDDSSLSQ